MGIGDPAVRDGRDFTDGLQPQTPAGERGELFASPPVDRVPAERRICLFALMLSAPIAAGCLWWLDSHPSITVGDAGAYHAYALQIRAHGLAADIGSIRPYGYPAFLALISLVTERLGPLPLFAGIVQYALYAGASVWLARQVVAWSGTLATAISIGLLVNPFLIAIVVDCISEGLAMPIAVALTALAVHAGRAQTRAALIGALGGGALLAAFAVAVRPASIVLAVAFGAACLVAIARRPPPRASTAALAIVACGVAALTSLMPQLIYNVQTWGVATALPVCRLGEVQVFYGIAMLRYDTLVIDNAGSQYFYLNPFATADPVAGHPINWYFSHVLAGVGTVSLRFFTAFSIDHLFAHLHGLRNPFRFATLTLYWALFLLGGLRACCLLWGVLRARPIAAGTPAITFLGVAALTTLGLVGISAVELRFNVLPVAILSVLAIDALMTGGPAAVRLRLGALILAAACVLTAASEIVLTHYGTGGPLKIVPRVTLSPLKCYTFASEARS